MRVVTLDSNKKVVSIKDVGDSYILGVNDIATDLGEMGQIQQADGSFINDPTPPPPAPPDPIQGIQDNFDIMYAQMLKLQGVTVNV